MPSRTRCATYYTRCTLGHTALPACIFLRAKTPRLLPLGNSAFGTQHHAAPHQCTTPHRTSAIHHTHTGRHQRSPRKICCAAACCSILRHAVACFKPLVGVTKISKKLQTWQTATSNTNPGCLYKIGTAQCLLQLPTANSLWYSWLSPCFSWVVLSPQQWVQQ